MIPPPIPLGLFLCDQVIVDQHTRKPSPIGIFTGLAVETFPSDKQHFSIFAALTEGNGNGTMELVANRLDAGEQIYSKVYPISFPDPLLVVNVNIRVRDIRFPVPGLYEFILRVDGDPIAQRKVRVYQG